MSSPASEARRGISENWRPAFSTNRTFSRHMKEIPGLASLAWDDPFMRRARRHCDWQEREVRSVLASEKGDDNSTSHYMTCPFSLCICQLWEQWCKSASINASSKNDLGCSFHTLKRTWFIAYCKASMSSTLKRRQKSPAVAFVRNPLSLPEHLSKPHHCEAVLYLQGKFLRKECCRLYFRTWSDSK